MLLLVGVALGVYFGVTADSANALVSDCRFKVCNTCFNSLETAVMAPACSSSSNDSDMNVVDILTDSYSVLAPITLGSKSITLSGKTYQDANNVVPVISAEFSLQEGGMLEWNAASEQDLILRNLRFTGNGHYLSAVRTTTSTLMNFVGEEIAFDKFSVPNGVHGAAIYLDQVGTFELDAKSSATGNQAGNAASGCPDLGGYQSEYCNGCTGYYGGAPIYINKVYNKLNFDGVFEDNMNMFNHGQGGVLFIMEISAKSSFIKGTFRRNSATEGGAFVVDTVRSGDAFNIDGSYEKNSATDPYGHCGSRGGAMTVRSLEDGSTVTINGEFLSNNAEAWGGVLRNDKISGQCTLNLLGSFTGNTAERGNIANLRDLSSGSIFRFQPSNTDQIAPDDIKFGTDSCNNVSTSPDEIICMN
eukprot:CFRG5000T1